MLFRGKQISNERNRVSKERMTAATFTAWQTLSAQSKKFPKWEAYLKMFGLSDELEVTKEDLKREYEHSIDVVNRIVAKARGTRASR